MFISYRKFDIISYFIIGIIIALSGKRFIYGGIIIAYSASLLFQKQIESSYTTYKYKNITFMLPAVIFASLIFSSLYVLSKSTIVSNQQKLLSVVFLILSLSHSIARNISKNEIFKKEITKYISTLLFIVVLFTVGFVPENQQILDDKYNELRNNLYRF